jgi:pimeloyl-ACP methyl ester carboxylesterase
MYKMIPLLTNPAAHGGDERDAFDVVIPSLPGFGYSSAPEKPGCDIETIGELWGALMNGLGYERFGAHGGDWGAHVTLGMGRIFPGHLIGLHVNYVPGAWRPFVGKDDPPLAESEVSSIRDRERWESESGAYAHVHSTRPQTVAYALTDSPVGLASWMLDLFRGISDCGGRADNAISKDEMLTIISIYWFTRSIASSIRLYREVRNGRQFTWEPEKRIVVPCGIARFPVEIARQPRALVERFMNVVHWTDMPSGGHFAPLEEPELLAEDLRTFFRPLR